MLFSSRLSQLGFGKVLGHSAGWGRLSWDEAGIVPKGRHTSLFSLAPRQIAPAGRLMGRLTDGQLHSWRWVAPWVGYVVMVFLATEP